MQSIRPPTTVSSASAQAEGAGASVIRAIGTSKVRNIDPWLMMDEFYVQKPHGFPDHPHRGFETITYMGQGEIAHNDGRGEFVIGPGALQLMKAADGVIHSEMPHSDGVTSGIQLWINLSSKNKKQYPTYEEVLPDQYKSYDVFNDQKAKIGSVDCFWGNLNGTLTPCPTTTPSLYYRLVMDKPGTFEFQIPEHWNGFIYSINGEANLSEKTSKKPVLLKTGHIATYERDTMVGPSVVPTKDGFDEYNLESEWKSLSRIQLHVTSVKSYPEATNDKRLAEMYSIQKAKPAQFFIGFGRPLDEPVYSHGPFVLNSQDELYETIFLLRTGKLAKVPKVVGKHNPLKDLQKTPTTTTSSSSSSSS